MHYRVQGRWLDDLWTDDKLEHADYAEQARRGHLNYCGRKRDLEAVLADEREAKVNQTMAEVDLELAKLRAPFRTFPEVTAWEDTFLTLQFRWKLLFLVQTTFPPWNGDRSCRPPDKHQTQHAMSRSL